METRTKVFFVQLTGEKEYETESLWCKSDGDYFVVDNIPFIAKRISLGDTIEAEFDDDDGQYYFEDFIASSGNSTLRLYVYENQTNKIDQIKKWLQEKQCSTEVFLDRNIIAVNVPKNVSYQPIKKYLDQGEGNCWTYEESCLEHDY